jgi:predicted AlkP superfamily pyrophosphatase or phosphodiesterase
MRKLVALVIVAFSLAAVERAAAQGQPKPVTAEDLARYRAGRAGAKAPAARDAAKAPAAKDAAKALPGPKLVLLLVVDQMRAATLERQAPYFVPGGFLRLKRQGAVLTGHYGHQNTYTGPGHALIATGAYGYLNGIVQNKWFNRKTNQAEAMIYDSTAKVLGGGKGGPDEENSPRNLTTTTFGDELRLANAGRSKVIAVAVKERGSVLTGGRFGQAYWLSEQSGQFTSSTYYMQALPGWVQAFNAKRPFDAWFGKTWQRLLPPHAYVGEDDFPFEGSPAGLGRTFPHPLTGKLKAPGPAFYEALAHTPIATDVTFDLARAALDGERLGARGVTDVLSVSISTTDLVGHLYGDHSHEYQDVVYRLDRSLAAFLADLDRRFKAGEVLIVLTADHGATPIPELVGRMGIESGRIKKATIKKAIEQALGARFGEGKWVVALEDPSVYLDHRLIAERKLQTAEVQRVAGEALLAIPGIIHYYTRTQILNGWLPPTAVSKAVARSYYPPRCGDVVILTQPFFYWGKYGEKDVGSTHGTPYRYDTDVPVVFVGAPFRPGRHGEIEMVDVAATVAYVLGLTPPAACEGRAVTRILK